MIKAMEMVIIFPFIEKLSFLFLLTVFFSFLFISPQHTTCTLVILSLVMSLNLLRTDSCVT
jgi:hypothetical protein